MAPCSPRGCFLSWRCGWGQLVAKAQPRRQARRDPRPILTAAPGSGNAQRADGWGPPQLPAPPWREAALPCAPWGGLRCPEVGREGAGPGAVADRRRPAQALYLDAVQYFPDEVQEVVDLMTEKELRVRLPLEELELLLE